MSCLEVSLFQGCPYRGVPLYTSVKIIKNEVGCRDETVPKLLKQEGTARRIESMQQSSITPKNQEGLQKIVACSHSSSQCLLVSIVFGTVSQFLHLFHSFFP